MMDGSTERAPRVPRRKIRRLFAGDAQGMLDEYLVEDVAFALYARCADLLEARGLDAADVAAQAAQPRARRVVERPATWEGFVKRQRYPWEIAWQEDFEAYRRRPFDRGGDAEALAYFVTRLGRARTPREKMLLINLLMHECWASLQDAPPPGATPLAVQLISGGTAEIRALLDALAYGSGTP